MTTDAIYLITIVILLLLGIALTRLRPEPRLSEKTVKNTQLPLKALLLYPAIMFVFGFLPATTIFLFWVARHNHKSWSFTLCYCFGVATLIYGVLFFVIGNPLPLGLIVQLLEN